MEDDRQLMVTRRWQLAGGPTGGSEGWQMKRKRNGGSLCGSWGKEGKKKKEKKMGRRDGNWWCGENGKQRGVAKIVGVWVRRKCKEVAGSQEWGPDWGIVRIAERVGKWGKKNKKENGSSWMGSRLPFLGMSEKI